MDDEFGLFLRDLDATSLSYLQPNNNSPPRPFTPSSGSTRSKSTRRQPTSTQSPEYPFLSNLTPQSAYMSLNPYSRHLALPSVSSSLDSHGGQASTSVSSTGQPTFMSAGSSSMSISPDDNLDHSGRTSVIQYGQQTQLGLQPDPIVDSYWRTNIAGPMQFVPDSPAKEDGDPSLRSISSTEQPASESTGNACQSGSSSPSSSACSSLEIISEADDDDDDVQIIEPDVDDEFEDVIFVEQVPKKKRKKEESTERQKIQAQANLQNAEISELKQKELEQSEQIKRLTQQNKELQQELSLFKRKAEVDGEEIARLRKRKELKCVICLEVDEKDGHDLEIKATKCGHLYCAECLQNAMRQSHFCSLCRQKITHRTNKRIFAS